MIALTLAGFSSAALAEWTVQDDTSAVILWVDKQGTYFNGEFEVFTARIDFDPDQPAAGHISGIVQTDSFATPDDQNHTYVVGYLETEQYPEARFVSTSIETLPEGFRALGNLTLKGITNPVAFDFTLTPGEATPDGKPGTRLSGSMNVNRFDFDIASDIDINWAGQNVVVQVELELTR